MTAFARDRVSPSCCSSAGSLWDGCWGQPRTSVPSWSPAPSPDQAPSGGCGLLWEGGAGRLRGKAVCGRARQEPDSQAGCVAASFLEMLTAGQSPPRQHVALRGATAGPTGRPDARCPCCLELVAGPDPLPLSPSVGSCFTSIFVPCTQLQPPSWCHSIPTPSFSPGRTSPGPFWTKLNLAGWTQGYSSWQQAAASVWGYGGDAKGRGTAPSPGLAALLDPWTRPACPRVGDGGCPPSMFPALLRTLHPLPPVPSVLPLPPTQYLAPCGPFGSVLCNPHSCDPLSLQDTPPYPYPRAWGEAQHLAHSTSHSWRPAGVPWLG